jgi:hypothetical protein
MNSQRKTQSQEVAQQLEATSQAGLAAHDAHLREATGRVDWQRRGWLGRLTRVARLEARR